VRLDTASNVTLDGLTIQDYNSTDGQDQYRAGIASRGGKSGLTVEETRSLGGWNSPARQRHLLKNTGERASGDHTITSNTIIERRREG